MFTCFAARAVHIDAVEGYDTNRIINALVRFINQRGKPDHNTSNCGTNFEAAVKELEIGLGKVNEFVRKSITWNFNPPASPHIDGVWERTIRTMKEVMYKIFKNAVFMDY